MVVIAVSVVEIAVFFDLPIVKVRTNCSMSRLYRLNNVGASHEMVQSSKLTPLPSPMARVTRPDDQDGARGAAHDLLGHAPHEPP